MYNLDYYEKMLRNYSKTAEEICHKRWHFLENGVFRPNDITEPRVLDYGSGVGWFRAFKPHYACVWTYDIAQYPQTGIKLQTYDCVCFWDVLEHIPDFREIEPVLALSSHVALSVPVPTDGLSDWKHFKPGEHLHYFTEDSLTALLAKYSFFPFHMKKDIECPPREDILSAIFRRKQ